MHTIVWLFKFLLKAAIFFTLFAFAINNQSEVTLRFFFGKQWTAPLVLVVLAVFSAGCVVGIVGTLPRWRRARNTQPPATPERGSANGSNGSNSSGGGSSSGSGHSSVSTTTVPPHTPHRSAEMPVPVYALTADNQDPHSHGI